MNHFGGAVHGDNLAILVSEDDALAELVEHGQLDFLPVILQTPNSLWLSGEIEQHPAKMKIVKLPRHAKKGRNARSGPSLLKARAGAWAYFLRRPATSLRYFSP